MSEATHGALERAPQPRTGLHVLCVALVGAAFVLNGSSPAGGQAGDDGRRVFDATAVAQILAERNPDLSPVERRRIGEAVLRSSARNGLDPMLVTAVLLRESDARPWAQSPKGALGLMQVMPHMMLPLDLAGNASTIESNVEAGCLILAENIRRLGEEDGISAYFWGSQIRGVSYLRRVQATLAELRATHRSS